LHCQPAPSFQAGSGSRSVRKRWPKFFYWSLIGRLNCFNQYYNMNSILIFRGSFMAKKAQRGGARKGAGRPPKEGIKTVVIGVSIPEDLASELDTFAKAKGWARSRAVTEALAAMLKRKTR
jgi:hypothetical protein